VLWTGGRVHSRPLVWAMSRSSPNAGILFYPSRVEKIVKEYPEHPAFVRCRNDAHGRACWRDVNDRPGRNHHRIRVALVHPDNPPHQPIAHGHRARQSRRGAITVWSGAPNLVPNKFRANLTSTPHHVTRIGLHFGYHASETPVVSSDRPGYSAYPMQRPTTGVRSRRMESNAGCIRPVDPSGGGTQESNWFSHHVRSKGNQIAYRMGRSVHSLHSTQNASDDPS
jgi:hypothetical protein